MGKSYVILLGLSLIVSLAFVIVAATMTITTSEQQQSLHIQVKDSLAFSSSSSSKPTLQEFPVPVGSYPHDVAPAAVGKTIWYTALGRLDPITGKTHSIALGKDSAPHGVIAGQDGAPWVTDGGLNAIVSIDPATEKLRMFPLPNGSSNANLNTATFDHNGVLWFTGQSGIYGRLDPSVGERYSVQSSKWSRTIWYYNNTWW
jgi:streptogramin lyase